MWQDGAEAYYPDHTHAGLTAHIILDGEMTLTMDGKSQTYHAGERCDVPAGAVHSARMGPQGCRYWSVKSRGSFQDNSDRSVVFRFRATKIREKCRAVEEFDHVQDFVTGAVDGGAGAELQDAAGIGGDDGLRLAFASRSPFSARAIRATLRFPSRCTRPLSRSTGPPAAFPQIHAGNGADQLARGFADFLSVREVAGILIGDAQRNLTERRGQAELGEEFGDVAHFCCENFRLARARGRLEGTGACIPSAWSRSRRRW